jgi:hypothetical protein
VGETLSNEEVSQVKISIRMNVEECRQTCALCEVPSPFGIGPAFFLDPEDRLICSVCARKESPTLYAVLLDFYGESFGVYSKEGKVACSMRAVMVVGNGSRPPMTGPTTCGVVRVASPSRLRKYELSGLCDLELLVPLTLVRPCNALKIGGELRPRVCAEKLDAGSFRL